MKTCNDCGEPKSLDEFYLSSANSYGKRYPMAYCKVCWGKRAKRHRDNMTPEQRKKYDERHRTPEAIWRRNLWVKYRLRPDRYEEMLDAQGGVCAICRETPSDGKPLCVDHDHACCSGSKSCGHCVRGLLCGNCNWMIGLAKDEVERLERAIEYLGASA